ncbi:Mitochondrial distribution/morphology family 35/apoptosis [Metarhizium album ARSEF 1941]|uniref:Mitochondrial distribution/morphology family 35/apoptosis n=1 Tax=Metarhizium album (strain ARSEF 1941) TaxID=1081103 RepID=A0A0B2WU76_METAS|nr:Mitochondrial distribution/morphology family 35/apoptosis [Metarhizium album ARSEF 1941]KHN97194.1 Mitochondrial distribution/morphology family 35/apoptosis [Metarhizium album ARSEF 1941]
MSASLAPECNEVKERYDTCFLKWYSEKYLRGAETDNKECADLFKQYQKCLGVALKDRGIDKLLDDAREDNKENDASAGAQHVVNSPPEQSSLFGCSGEAVLLPRNANEIYIDVVSMLPERRRPFSQKVLGENMSPRATPPPIHPLSSTANVVVVTAAAATTTSPWAELTACLRKSIVRARKKAKIQMMNSLATPRSDVPRPSPRPLSITPLGLISTRRIGRPAWEWRQGRLCSRAKDGGIALWSSGYGKIIAARQAQEALDQREIVQETESTSLSCIWKRASLPTNGAGHAAQERWDAKRFAMKPSWLIFPGQLRVRKRGLQMDMAADLLQRQPRHHITRDDFCKASRTPDARHMDWPTAHGSLYKRNV